MDAVAADSPPLFSVHDHAKLAPVSAFPPGIVENSRIRLAGMDYLIYAAVASATQARSAVADLSQRHLR
jgi:hypothetical protein